MILYIKIQCMLVSVYAMSTIKKTLNQLKTHHNDTPTIAYHETEETVQILNMSEKREKKNNLIN